MNIEIDFELLRRRKLFIATPMYGGMCAHNYHTSCIELTALASAYQLPVYFNSITNESLVQRGRNQLVHTFLQTDCTHLMFIDADIGFKAEDVLALLAIADPKSDKQILCGPYPKKTIAWQNIKKAVEAGKANDKADTLSHYIGDFVLNALNKDQTISLNEVAPVKESGSGFMMIQRSVFEAFKDHYPQQCYQSDYKNIDHIPQGTDMFAYFDCIIDPETKRYLSEDYMFCYYARKMGYSIWLCPWIKLSHAGSFLYQSSLEALGSIGASAT